eukprot:Em0005g457a
MGPELNAGYSFVTMVAIVLYESILKQGITSYVKGGYLLRKALKILVCRARGDPLYDQDGDKLEEVDGGAGSEDQREAVDLEGQRELAASLAAVAEGIGGMGLESGLLEMSEGERMPRLSDVQEDTPTTNGSSAIGKSGSSSPDPNVVDLPGGVVEPGSSRTKGCPAIHQQGSREDGYILPKVSSPSVASLDHKDLRLRGAVYLVDEGGQPVWFPQEQESGASVLEFSSNSQDAKAPLARIALLWYHTIVRPFFTLDGEQDAAAVLDHISTALLTAPLDTQILIEGTFILNKTWQLLVTASMQMEREQGSA